jgi:AGCS family alanine or glycine:cation symporter
VGGDTVDYLRPGQGIQGLAVLYAVRLIAAFAIGFNAFQGNTVAGAAQESLGIDRIWSGAALSIIAGFIVFGGIRRIAKAADIVVPIMAVGCLVIAVIVLLLNITSLPGVLTSIVLNAFGFEQAVGGGMGAALSQGLRRGLFSKEAGLGSAPNVAATADVRHPISQGITQSFSVFIDTIVICSCTAFIVLLGDVYVPGIDIDGVVLAQQSLASQLGDWTRYFLTFILLLFAFSSFIYNCAASTRRRQCRAGERRVSLPGCSGGADLIAPPVARSSSRTKSAPRPARTVRAPCCSPAAGS